MAAPFASVERQRQELRGTQLVDMGLTLTKQLDGPPRVALVESFEGRVPLEYHTAACGLPADHVFTLGRSSIFFNPGSMGNTPGAIEGHVREWFGCTGLQLAELMENGLVVGKLAPRGHYSESQADWICQLFKRADVMPMIADPVAAQSAELASPSAARQDLAGRLSAMFERPVPVPRAGVNMTAAKARSHIETLARLEQLAEAGTENSAGQALATIEHALTRRTGPRALASLVYGQFLVAATPVQFANGSQSVAVGPGERASAMQRMMRGLLAKLPTMIPANTAETASDAIRIPRSVFEGGKRRTIKKTIKEAHRVLSNPWSWDSPGCQTRINEVHSARLAVGRALERAESWRVLANQMNREVKEETEQVAEIAGTVAGTIAEVAVSATLQVGDSTSKILAEVAGKGTTMITTAFLRNRHRIGPAEIAQWPEGATVRLASADGRQVQYRCVSLPYHRALTSRRQLIA